ncbi:hypothetical protein MPSEU_000789100 [Mayamaea pseudoterrestris]|nr:hypothetical protein MPSEU_000789100 [Mayamaea pseudoterrestris]
MRIARAIPMLASMFVASSRAWVSKNLPLRSRQAIQRSSNHIFAYRGGAALTSDSRHQPATPSSSALYASISSSTSSIHVNNEAFGVLEPEIVALLSRPQFPVKEFGGILYQETKVPSSRQEKQLATAQDDSAALASKTNIFKVIFILGGPGAGKGTQSALMSEHFPVVHFSVGDLLRREQAKTDPPSVYKEILDDALVHGSIVPVQVSLGLLQQAMQEKALELGNDILFLVDGFPRNFDNLKGWITVMQDVAVLWSVLVYTCPLNVLEQRILKRGKDSGRADDNLSSVKKRFNTFATETTPVINSLKQISKTKDCPWTVVDICGDCPLADVWVASQQALNQLIKHDVLTANAALLDAVQSGDVARYQALCDDQWFDLKSPVNVMREQEGEPVAIGSIVKAQLDVISGKQVAVGYERVIQGVRMREKRIWSHQGIKGWRNIHFSRTPFAEQ